MGANQFEVSGKGNSVAEAFQNAVQDAQYENGHVC